MGNVLRKLFHNKYCGAALRDKLQEAGYTTQRLSLSLRKKVLILFATIAATRQ